MLGLCKMTRQRFSRITLAKGYMCFILALQKNQSMRNHSLYCYWSLLDMYSSDTTFQVAFSSQIF